MALTTTDQTGKKLFDPVVSKEIINGVRGQSALARLCPAEPIRFNGTKFFTFTMDNDIAIVGEGAQKGVGGVTLSPKTVLPIKVEYGSRVTDEFLLASDEEQFEYIKPMLTGFQNKLAKAIDTMAIHGKNPRTGVVSNLINDYFDKDVTQIVTADSNDQKILDAIENAVDAVMANDVDPNGLVISNQMRRKMAVVRASDGSPLVPHSEGGNTPLTYGAMTVVRGSGVYGDEKDLAIAGDFSYFRWGFAKDISMDIIRFGNPDNAENGDLSNLNQIYIRFEAYLGWAILDPTAFVIIKDADTTNDTDNGDDETDNG